MRNTHHNRRNRYGVLTSVGPVAILACHEEFWNPALGRCTVPKAKSGIDLGTRATDEKEKKNLVW